MPLAFPSPLRLLLPLALVAALVVLGGLARCYTVMVLPALLLSVPFGLLSLAGGWHLARPARERPTPAAWPTLTLLIPAHNEAAVLAETLASVLAQDYPGLEVIVVDDHSTDETAERASKFPVRLVRLEGGRPGGKSAALNAGWAIATGQVIGVLDADARLGPGCLRQAVAPLALDAGLCATQARLRLANPHQSFWTRLQADELGILNDCIEAGRTRLGTAARLLGNGQFLRREALAAVDGWAPGLVDDLDLTLRLALAGAGRVAFVPEAIVQQEGVPGLAALLRQRTRWCEGHLQALGRYGGPVLASSLPARLKADLLVILGSIALPLLSLSGLAAGGLMGLGHFQDQPLALALSSGTGLLTIAGILAVGAAARRLDGAWRWLPAVHYALLMPVFAVAVLRALASLASGGAPGWDKTARVAPLEATS